MNPHQRLLARLAIPNTSKVVLLVLDGVGDLSTAAQPQTALEAASTPNLDALAAAGALGRAIPVATGITPGSGPGHLALFGYDPTLPEADIGRGVLEALGLGIRLDRAAIAVRGNFATADADGNLVDRRAGRIASAECARVIDAVRGGIGSIRGLDVELVAGEGHRFVVVLRGEDLSDAVADTDPQRLGVAPLPPRALGPAAESTARRVAELLAAAHRVVASEPKANRLLLRGFSRSPALESLAELHQARFGAFAGYPLYRGVAAACGMEVVECPKDFAGIVDVVTSRWNDFDVFFLHVKQTDQAGEDGNLAAKVAVLEQVDQAIPKLLALGPEVVCVTADHSTPAPMAAHSWHPVPVLVHAPLAFVDETRRFTEAEAVRGHLGTFPARELMGLLLAHAGRLAKYGA
jgi:2,3-bisphosphoglycerate-independent phosphoglycerate mutase